MSILNRMKKQHIENLVFHSTPIEDIITLYEGKDFVEVVGTAGRDTLTYRIYENGMVTEK
jgi:hypothetical protein